MVCPYCKNKTEVTNTRLQKRLNSVWRRRRCITCGAIFTSLERMAYESSLTVKDHTSHIVPFERDRLFLSIYDACRHRPNAITDASSLTDTIMGKLQALAVQQTGMIDRISLIKITSETLRQFDMAASVSYLAYHPL